MIETFIQVLLLHNLISLDKESYYGVPGFETRIQKSSLKSYER